MVIRRERNPSSLIFSIILTVFVFSIFVTPAYAIEVPEFLFQIMCFCGALDGVDTDSADRIIITDPRTARILVTDSKGSTLFFFGSYGTEDGQFNWPYNIAVDSQDRIIISDFFLNRIQVFDSNGNFLFKFDTPSPIRGGITTDSNDRIIASDGFNSQIIVFDSNGNLLFSFPMIQPIAVDTESQNKILVSTNKDKIYVFDSNGNSLFNFGSDGSGEGQLSSPLGIAVDSFDNIIVAEEDNNRVSVFDSNGNFLYNFGSKGTGPGQFDEPIGAAVNSKDHILILDADNSRVQVFGVLTPQEKILKLFDFLEALDLSSNAENSLTAPLETAIEHLDDGVEPNDASVCGQLGAFLSIVNAKEQQGIISPIEAAELRFIAFQTLIELGCGS